MSILMILYFIFMVMLLFGVTIFIHELGHFLVARKLGMQADVFSIGFGHAIWKRKHDGVVYKIGWIPCGGYVALPQMEPGGGRTVDEDGNEVRLPRVAPWRKILVALAGAAGNVLLAIVLAYVIFWNGKPSSLPEVSSVVGFVATNSAAYAEGLRIADEVVEVNAKPVSNWEDVSIQAALSDEVSLRVKCGNQFKTIDLVTESGALGIKGVKGIPGVDGPSYCMVDRPVPGSSAEQAGVMPRDRVVSFDGVTLFSISHLIDRVEANRDRTVPMVVERDHEEIELAVTPAYDEESDRVLIGILFDRFRMNADKLVHPTPSQQIRKHAGLIFTTLRALVTPKEAKNAANAIGGPPMIFQYLYAMVESSFIMALWFTCLLNVNLAIINLVPLPVLDGGHIMFALFEMITRRPTNERFATALTTIFAVLLITAMLFLSVRDIDRIIDSRRSIPTPEDTETNELPVETPVAETPATE